MKRIAFFLILSVFAVSFAQAQRSEVRRAERQLNRGILNEAITHIETALQDPTTEGEVETWLLKAKIYMQVAMSEDPEYSQLVENPVQIADEAANKALEMEPTNVEYIQIQQVLMVISELAYNEGVEFFNADRFAEASKRFVRSYELNESFGVADTTTLYNAGLAAELGGQHAEAKEIYKKLMEMEYDQPYLFSSMANIHMFEGDTATALEYILKGRKAYPDDLNMIFNEANIYIFTGNSEKAKDILALAIEKDPENPGLYFALAANFDRMSQDTTYSAADRKSFFNEAESRYKQAIEIDNEYFDAIYNLGVLYFNEGIRIYDEADANLRRTQDFAQYEKDALVFQESWLRSQPYFEQARSMLEEDDPYFETVIISLVQLYARTNQPEKLQEVEEIYRRHFATEEEE